jgi:uncharacterized repeat protein (TIGR03806 family)
MNHNPGIRINIILIIASILSSACQRSSSSESIGLCQFPGRAPDSPSWPVGVELFASGLPSPTAIRPIPSSTDLLVTLKSGVIVRLSKDGSRYQSSVLDISDRADADNFETGLLSVAVHPEFPTDRRIFVVYTMPREERGHIWRLSQFEVNSPDEWVAESKSETILIEIDKETKSHNGGDLAFDTKGMLVIGIGDGNHYGDPNNHAQRLNTLRGKIIRIDVDKPKSPKKYGIPVDNPTWKGAKSARPEIYAYGFRNPWRLGFDRKTGELWVGDFGDRTYEEINLIQQGGNYGWRYWEGSFCRRTADCRATKNVIDPVYAYSRGLGNGIIGGYVYRGKMIPELVGKYVFTDFSGQVIQALTVKDGVKQSVDAITQSGGNVVSFGEDNEGELYYAAMTLDSIYKVVPSDPPSSADFPLSLSATGCFEDLESLTLARPSFDYQVNAPLWSDGTEKSRQILFPKDTLAGVIGDKWMFPNGSLFVKNFFVRDETSKRIPIETRFIMKRNGHYEGYSYRWNEAGDDAELVGIDGERAMLTTHIDDQKLDLDYEFPSREGCAKCHNGSSSESPLGVHESQLCQEDSYDFSSCESLRELGDFVDLALSPPKSKAVVSKVIPDYQDTKLPIATRARAYLHANCAYCHNAVANTAQSKFDLSFARPFAETGICNAEVVNQSFTAKHKLLKPGEPDWSALYLRMTSLDEKLRMPPLATHRVDSEGADMVRRWIISLNSCE